MSTEAANAAPVRCDAAVVRPAVVRPVPALDVIAVPSRDTAPYCWANRDRSCGTVRVRSTHPFQYACAAPTPPTHPPSPPTPWHHRTTRTSDPRSRSVSVRMCVEGRGHIAGAPTPNPAPTRCSPPTGEHSGQRARKRPAGSGRAQPGHPPAAASRRPHLLLHHASCTTHHASCIVHASCIAY